MPILDTFRIANHSDVEDIVTLVNMAYRPASNAFSGWTHETDFISGERINATQLLDILAKPNIVIVVAIKNLTIVACVEIKKQDNVSYIGMLAVSPVLQGKGLGKQVLAYAEHYARLNFNADKFMIMVLASRFELIAFYLRRGYQKNGGIIEYPLSAGVGIPKQLDIKLEVLEKSATQCSIK
jgi:ribosomal protein S18 acetylase RimI-like enzyme